MGAVPTVKIQDDDFGFLIINASDYDPSEHERYRENVPPDESASEGEEEAPYRVEAGGGGWWKVLDVAGEQVGPAYRSEGDATAALATLELGEDE